MKIVAIPPCDFVAIFPRFVRQLPCRVVIRWEQHSFSFFFFFSQSWQQRGEWSERAVPCGGAAARRKTFWRADVRDNLLSFSCPLSLNLSVIHPVSLRSLRFSFFPLFHPHPLVLSLRSFSLSLQSVLSAQPFPLTFIYILDFSSRVSFSFLFFFLKYLRVVAPFLFFSRLFSHVEDFLKLSFFLLSTAACFLLFFFLPFLTTNFRYFLCVRLAEK